jgi:ubiquinone biosynthesis protein UbiJ
MPATPAWLASAEALLNRNLDATDAGASLLKRAEHSSLQVEIDGMTRIRALVASGRLMLVPGDDTPADATISGPPMALWNLARGSSQGVGTARGATAHGTPSVQVHGNAEVAGLYREIFALARPDWEEELSRWVGDIPARQLSRAAKQALTWVRGAGRSFGENISEYLTEESRDLVNSVEHAEFLRGVDRVRETADRIDARLARLEQRLRG